MFLFNKIYVYYAKILKKYSLFYRLPRKRHIGNDIVTIIFLHEDFTGPAFTPSLIRSKFQQVFIIIKPINNGQFYRVAVARHRQVPLFGPPLKPYYSRHELKDFILTKIINAENAYVFLTFTI